MAYSSVLGNGVLGDFVLGLEADDAPPPPTTDKEVLQTLSLQQSVVVTRVINLTASNTLALSQNSVRTIPASASDVLDFDQDASFLKWKNAYAASVLSLTQTLAKSYSLNKNVQHTLVMLSRATRTLSKVEDIQQALTLAQQVTVIVTKLATNILTFTQTADYTVAKNAKNLLELQQFLAVSTTINKNVNHYFEYRHAVELNTFLNRNVTSTLNLTQTVIGLVVKDAKNVFNILQSVLVEKVTPAANYLHLLQDVAYNATINTKVKSTITFKHKVTYTRSKALAVGHVLAFEQSTRRSKVISVAASNVLSLTGDLVHSRFNESVSQVLSLAQSVTKQKRVDKVISQALTLTQSVIVKKTINLTATNHLALNDRYRQIWTGLPAQPIIGIPAVIPVLIRPSGPVGPPAVLPGQPVDGPIGPPGQVSGPLGGGMIGQPASIPTIVRRFSIIQGRHSSIVMPTPEFGDSQGITGQTKVKRAMNGARYTYKNLTNNDRLKYEFVLDRAKALEFRNFIRANNSEPIQMLNWKGEFWLGFFTNNPFDIVEEGYRNAAGGNRCTLTLEFEGIRLN